MTGILPHVRANARKLRQEATAQERKLWRQLREVNRMLGTHFRRQAPIATIIADFADLGRKLVIEIDGGQHGGPDDAARDAWFAAQGFQVLRFWNTEVDGQIEGVMQVVLDAVETCAGASHGACFGVAPPHHPSPARGEGGALPRLRVQRPLAVPGASLSPVVKGIGVAGDAQDRSAIP